MYKLRNAHRILPHDSDIAREIIKAVKDTTFNDMKAAAVDKVLSKYYIYEEVRVSGKSPLWRLTLPLFFLWALFTLTILFPLNFVINGKWQYSTKSRHYKFSNKWNELIFGKSILNKW